MAIFQDPNISGGSMMSDFFSWFTSGLVGANGSIFGNVILMAIAVVSFLGSKAFSFDRALVVSGFLTFVAGLFMLRLGWIGSGAFAIAIIYFIIGIFYLIKDRGQAEA